MLTKFQRRHFMLGAAAATTMAGGLHTTQLFAKTIRHKPLDPVNPDLLFGTTGSIWGEAGVGATRVYSTEQALKHISQMGLQGVEPYAGGIEEYRSKPKELKALSEKYNVTIIDASNGEKGQSTNFIDKDQIPKTIADHVAFARDFLAVFGCDHWKINMGARPKGGPSDDQLKQLADTLNELGRRTLEFGIRLAPHPHIWGPIEREAETRRVLDLTDPKYVWLTADTGHLTLGGGDAVQIISDYFPRLAEVHLKDTYAKFRGNKETPTPEMHAQASVYHNFGAGGVDFPGVFKVLREKHFKGWVVMDVDGPRKGDDGIEALGSDMRVITDTYIAHNINYLRNVIGVKLPPYA
jgi:inosose dehydratase